MGLPETLTSVFGTVSTRYVSATAYDELARPIQYTLTTGLGTAATGKIYEQHERDLDHRAAATHQRPARQCRPEHRRGTALHLRRRRQHHQGRRHPGGWGRRYAVLHL